MQIKKKLIIYKDNYGIPNNVFINRWKTLHIKTSASLLMFPACIHQYLDLIDNVANAQ